MYVHFILGFKVMYFNAWGWSTWPKHVAYIDETNKTVVVDSIMYVSFDITYNRMNSTKIVIFSCQQTTNLNMLVYC
jgi:hypothetical protein